MIDFLKPAWIVPMHYNLPPLTAGMTKVDAFLERRPRDPVIYPRHHTVTFPLPPVGPGRPSIVVLEPPPISLFERGRATPHIENGLEPPAPALRSSHAVLAASASPVHLNRLR